jgi:ElaB/YqjD/DUF883 family membrane-anchored ribosome-binding protein
MGEAHNGNSQSAGLMDKLRNTAESQLGTQKDRASDGVSSVAQAVRQSTQQLRDNQHESIAQYVEQAVDRVERFAARLKEKDPNELVRDAQQFARRNPAVFVAAAFGVGIVAARFLKSSGRNGENSNGGWRQPTGGGAYTAAPRGYRPGDTDLPGSASFNAGTEGI